MQLRNCPGSTITQHVRLCSTSIGENLRPCHFITSTNCVHSIYERSETNLMHARNLGVVFGRKCSLTYFCSELKNNWCDYSHTHAIPGSERRVQRHGRQGLDSRMARRKRTHRLRTNQRIIALYLVYRSLILWRFNVLQLVVQKATGLFQRVGVFSTLTFLSRSFFHFIFVFLSFSYVHSLSSAP